MYTIGMNTEHPDPSKLASYIVVRKRLPVGMKAVSACHAAIAFCPRHEWPKFFKNLSLMR